MKNDNQVKEEAKKLKTIEGLTYDEAILISSTSEDEADDESNGKVKGIQVISYSYVMIDLWKKGNLLF
jgi:hypothetical protein